MSKPKEFDLSENQEGNVMLAEIKDSLAPTLVKLSGTVQVPVTVHVIAADPPNDTPTFTFEGLDTARSVWIKYEAADFTLTLSAEGFPEGWSVKYDTADPGPITWLTPGQLESRPKPDYITEPLSPDPFIVLTFTDTNTSIPDKDDLVSFVVHIVVTQPTGASARFNSRSHLDSSPDPTIINVDPPGSGA